MSKIKDGDTVKVHYTGKLENGDVFDSSRERDPFEFTVGNQAVIPGFEKGVVGMGVGDTKTIEIPPEEAYGAKQDELVVEYGRRYGLPYSIVRPGPVYGPGKAALTGRVGVGSFGPFLLVGGRNKLPLIYVENCAEAIVIAGLALGMEGQIAIAVDDNIDRTLSIVRMPDASNAATPSPAVTSGERHSRAKPTKIKMIIIAVSGAPIWVRSIKPETPCDHQWGGFWVGAPAVASASKSSMRPLSVSILRLNSAITLA